MRISRYSLSILLMASLIHIMASNVLAEIFTWKDSRGNTHYANSMYDVPERYRAKVKTVNLGIEEKGDNKLQQAATPGSAPPTAPPVAATQPMAAPTPQPQSQISPAVPVKGENRPTRRPRRSHDNDE